MLDSTPIVVTGASGALGRAIVKMAHEKGARLVVATRRETSAVGLPDDERCRHVRGVDLATTVGAAELARVVSEHLPPRPFAVLNCVGRFPGYGTIAEVDGDTAQEVFRSNVITVYNTAHALLPLMRARGGGRFVAFTSHTDYQAYPLMGAFGASKAALTQLVRHIANEESEFGVSANAFALATMLTESEVKLKPHGDHSAWLRPEEAAELALWFIGCPSHTVNGNTVHLFNYSRSYFHEAYFSRVRSPAGGEPK